MSDRGAASFFRAALIGPAGLLALLVACTGADGRTTAAQRAFRARLAADYPAQVRLVPGSPSVWVRAESGPDFGPIFMAAGGYGRRVRATPGSDSFAALTAIVLRHNGWQRLGEARREALLRCWLIAGQFPGVSLETDLDHPGHALDIRRVGSADRARETVHRLVREGAEGPTVMRVAPHGGVAVSGS